MFGAIAQKGLKTRIFGQVHHALFWLLPILVTFPSPIFTKLYSSL